MDSNKLITLSSKLRERYKGFKNSDDIFNGIINDTLITQLLDNKILSSIDLFYLSFLIYLTNKGNSPSTIFKLLKNFTFGVRVDFIDNDTPTTECDYCYGDGVVDCQECNGEFSCDVCDSGGSVECPQCEAYGEVDLDNNNSITSTYFLSINPKLRDFLLDYEGEKISEDSYFKIIEDVLTIKININYYVSDEYYGEYEVGDYILSDVVENPSVVRIGPKSFSYQ